MYYRRKSSNCLCIDDTARDSRFRRRDSVAQPHLLPSGITGGVQQQSAAVWIPLWLMCLRKARLDGFLAYWQIQILWSSATLCSLRIESATRDLASLLSCDSSYPCHRESIFNSSSLIQPSFTLADELDYGMPPIHHLLLDNLVRPRSFIP